MGALSLYLDFINLFLMLLRLFGNQRTWSTFALNRNASGCSPALFFCSI